MFFLDFAAFSNQNYMINDRQTDRYFIDTKEKSLQTYLS